MFDELNEKFNTGETVLPAFIEPTLPTINEPSPLDLASDSERVRDSLFSVMAYGEKAIEKIASIADATEHPRAFEVMSDMMRTIADVGDKVLEIHRTNATIAKKKQASGNVTNNNMFVGSTSELLKMLNRVEQEPETLIIHEHDQLPR